MQAYSTITFHFDAVEDRIRLIGNMEGENRGDFWLTRHLTLRILEALSNLLSQSSERASSAPSAHRDQMVQFEHESALSGMDVKQDAYDDDAFGGRLLLRIDITQGEGVYKLLLFTSKSETADAVFTLAHQELHQVLALLHQGAKTLDWGVDSLLFVSPTEQTYLQ